MQCLACASKLKSYQSKYCSNLCQKNYEHEAYIRAWKAAGRLGESNVHTKNISRHILRYLLEKYHNRCSRCGWAELHPQTGRAPLEVDHIDGNHGNNKEENLRILCPNCHSLTINYRNLNKGKGRLWRREKYAIIKKLPL